MNAIERCVDAIIERRNIAHSARQAYDDASAGVDDDPLHNAANRLVAADQLSDATYELCHHLDNLLTSVDFENLMLGLEE
jgi:hypothetical protein